MRYLIFFWVMIMSAALGMILGWHMKPETEPVIIEQTCEPCAVRYERLSRIIKLHKKTLGE